MCFGSNYVFACLNYLVYFVLKEVPRLGRFYEEDIKDSKTLIIRATIGLLRINKLRNNA